MMEILVNQLIKTFPEPFSADAKSYSDLFRLAKSEEIRSFYQETLLARLFFHRDKFLSGNLILYYSTLARMETHVHCTVVFTLYF
jgi:hypothetical protein